MTENDINYIKQLINKKKIEGPVLELGAGYGGNTCSNIIKENNLAYFTSDMEASQYVDYVADFESSNIECFFPNSVKFKSILVLNVIEHTFDPVRVLDNALKLLDKDGSLVIIAPSCWPLHSYPIDCYRFMPNFFEKYAHSRNLLIDLECFEYLGCGMITSHLDENNNYQFPLPIVGLSFLKSKIIHKLFNTFGRGMRFSNFIAIGAIFKKNNNSE